MKQSYFSGFTLRITSPLHHPDKDQISLLILLGRQHSQISSLSFKSFN